MKKIFFLFFLSLFIISGCSLNNPLQKSKTKILSLEDAKITAENFINKNLMQGGKATITNISEEGGLYKLDVNANGQKIASYLSKDGSKFFPQVLNIHEFQNEEESKETNTQVKKTDKPQVELFVMSYCPYGTQMEKGILPVVNLLKDKINFQLKFCDYAMHGEKELQENLRQYCIEQEQDNKLNSYLECFLKDADYQNCLKESKIDKNKLSSCMKTTDEKYKIMENFKDKKDYKGRFPSFNIFKPDNVRYQVGGSPTLIINGKSIKSKRDSNSLLKTICSAFNNSPKECQQKLSSDSPSPGFGTSSSSGGSNGSCN